ncbi:hypothetical protein DFS34DRAFT_614047 [Phlyctochytrium arcticum]|nr:hypothetical protein DFS34DRAFT_614047 [Phlyctochytrium arcticum]
MSHQSGIRPSQELLDAFAAAAQTQTTRALKVSLSEESLTLAQDIPVTGSWEDDFTLVTPLLKPTEPTFILYRKDTTNTSGAHEWILLQYVPDQAKVREKMLYASSKATLLKELGDARFVDTLYGTLPEELNLNGYRKYITHKEAAAPLTEREQEAQAVRKAESSAEISISSRRSHAQGVSFPFSEPTKQALSDLKSGEVNAVILRVDVKEEVIELDQAANIKVENVVALITPDVPRFVFITVKSDDGSSNTMFVYICPPTSNVKERMLYSASRANVVGYVTEELALPVQKKYEVDSAKEIDIATFADDLPQKGDTSSPLPRPAFARPARPGRGPARLSRPATPASAGSATPES